MPGSSFFLTERSYYYLVAGLPTLLLEQGKAPMTGRAFLEEVQPQLHGDDFAQCALLFLESDNYNLQQVIQRQEDWREGGNYAREQLEDGLREPEGLPSYMAVWVKAYQQEMPLVKGMSWENQLTGVFYEYLLEKAHPFLKQWFAYERDLRNLLTGLNARKHGFSVEGQLIGEYDLTEAIRSSRARDFGLGAEYPVVESLLQLDEQENLFAREMGADQLRWAFLEELNTFHYFSIEVLFAFLIKLRLLERWSQLDPARGAVRFEALVREMETSFEFPNEFSVI